MKKVSLKVSYILDCFRKANIIFVTNEDIYANNFLTKKYFKIRKPNGNSKHVVLKLTGGTFGKGSIAENITEEMLEESFSGFISSYRFLWIKVVSDPGWEKYLLVNFFTEFLPDDLSLNQK